MKKIIPRESLLIPDNAKCVFTGQIFSVFQWQQRQFDGSEATFEMLRRPDTVQIIAVRDGKIVVIEDDQPHRKPFTSLPGGRSEPADESWEAGARREMLEETGLHFRHYRLISVVQPAHKIEWFCPFFLAWDFAEEQSVNLDAGERITVSLMDFEELKVRAADPQDIGFRGLGPVISQYSSLEELLNATEFSGKEVNR